MLYIDHFYLKKKKLKQTHTFWLFFAPRSIICLLCVKALMGETPRKWVSCWKKTMNLQMSRMLRMILWFVSDGRFHVQYVYKYNKYFCVFFFSLFPLWSGCYVFSLGLEGLGARIGPGTRVYQEGQTQGPRTMCSVQNFTLLLFCVNYFFYW